MLAFALAAAACGTDTTPATSPTSPTGPSTTGPAATRPATTVPGTVDTSTPSLSTTEPPTVTGTVEPTNPPPSSSPGPPATDPALAPLAALAIADLAGRLGIPEAEITVHSSETVVWPDGALGCPQPGMAYPQVLVDGYRILLSAQGAIYHYHGGGERGPFLCEDPADG